MTLRLHTPEPLFGTAQFKRIPMMRRFLDEALNNFGPRVSILIIVFMTTDEWFFYVTDKCRIPAIENHVSPFPVHFGHLKQQETITGDVRIQDCTARNAIGIINTIEHHRTSLYIIVHHRHHQWPQGRQQPLQQTMTTLRTMKTGTATITTTMTTKQQKQQNMEQKK